MAAMIDENVKSLEKMVDEGYAELKEAVMKLRAALGKHGFRGTISCNLEVHIRDEDGFDTSKVSRSTEQKFKR